MLPVTIIIASQVQLVDHLRAKSLSTDQAEVVLDTLNDMMLVHQSFRQTIIDTIAH
jgi:ribosomal protein S13